MDEDITMCDAQTQSLTPPLNEDVPMTNALEFRGEAGSPSTILDRVKILVRSTYVEWSGVVRQLAVQPAHSRDTEFQNQVIAVLDGVIYTIDDALETPSIDEGLFTLVAILLGIRRLSHFDRFLLTKSPEDLDRSVYTHNLVSHFCEPSGSDLQEVSELLERLQLTTFEIVQIVTNSEGRHQSSSQIDYLTRSVGQAALYANLAYGLRCDDVRRLIYRRSNPAIWDSLGAQDSFLQLMTLMDCLNTVKAIHSRKHLLEQAVEFAINPLVAMDGVYVLEQDSRTPPTMSFRVESGSFSELLFGFLIEIEVIQSENIGALELIASTVDFILEIHDIDEDHFGIVIGLLLQLIDALLTRCRIFQDNISLDRACYMIGLVSHFCGISDPNPGIISGLPERFRSAQELKILLSHYSDQSQDIKDLTRIAELIQARRSQLTATELTAAALSIISAFAVFSLQTPQETAYCCNQILKHCNQFIPAIEDLRVRTCLRDYGTLSATYLSTASIHLELLIVDQVLTFIDICFQSGIEGEEFSSTSQLEPGSTSQCNDREVKWVSFALEILHALLRITAVAGNMSRVDTILRSLQNYSLPYESYGVYGLRLEQASKVEGSLRSEKPLIYSIDIEWSSIWNHDALHKFITALRRQFHSRSDSIMTQKHRSIIALLLASTISHSASSSKGHPFHPLQEAYPYFAYFLIHWDWEIPAWALPFCKALYNKVKSTSSSGMITRGGILARVRIMDIWDSRFQNIGSSKLKAHHDDLNQSRREVAMDRFVDYSKSELRYGVSTDRRTIMQIMMEINNEISETSDLTLTQCIHAFRKLEEIEDIDNLIPLDMAHDHQWDDRGTKAAFQWASGCFEFLRSSDTNLTDSEGVRLSHILDRFVDLARSELESPYDRARTVQYWLLLVTFGHYGGKMRVGNLAIRTIEEHFKIHFSLMWEIAWAALEEMNWMASSAWESIADRQVWHLYLEEIFLFTTNANQSTAEFQIQGIERFNGTIWTHLQRLRTPHDHLAELRPELSSRLQVLQDDLEKQWVHSNDDERVGLPAKFHEKSNAELLGEWSEILDEIRGLPGFERFFRGKSLHELAQASTRRGEPIVLIPRPYPYCETTAFIIYCDEYKPNSEPVVVRVPLPLFHMRKIASLHGWLTVRANTRTCGDTDTVCPQDIHFDSSSNLDGPEQDTKPSRLGIKSRKSAKKVENPSMDDILAELWEIVAYPVVDAIMQLRGYVGKGKSRQDAWQDSPPSRSARGRIWWCCLGKASFLPIHAAGIYYSHRKICVSDFFISSYTPSLSALADARNRPLPEPLYLRILAAAQPTPGGGQIPLPNTKRELEEIAAIVPEEKLVYLGGQDKLDLTGEHTTVQNVLEMLPQISIFHLACHGQQDKVNPLKSGFILKGGERLTLQDLIKLRVPKAYMAVLSACHTASNDAMQPEEVMNMTRTAMFLGFRTIVGTKWPMTDADGPIVAKAVYSALFAVLNSESGQGDGNDAILVDGAGPLPTRNPLESFCLATVVDDIVQGLREGGAPPERWATFVHIGI